VSFSYPPCSSRSGSSTLPTSIFCPCPLEDRITVTGPDADELTGTERVALDDVIVVLYETIPAGLLVRTTGPGSLNVTCTATFVPAVMLSGTLRSIGDTMPVLKAGTNENKTMSAINRGAVTRRMMFDFVLDLLILILPSFVGLLTGPSDDL
jgi:hypothetical protein